MLDTGTDHSLQQGKHNELHFSKITPELDGAKEENEQIIIHKYTECDLLAMS